MKFGGTAVKDAAALRNVVSIIKQSLVKKPVVVVSAMAGITDLLEESVKIAVNQQSELVMDSIDKIESQHIMSLLRQADIHLDLISQFATQISFMFIIEEKDIKKTVKLLHKEFIEKYLH